jgi:hypothetical protein
MRIFNRIVLILLLAGLFLLGVYMVVYSFDLFGHKLADLPFSPAGKGISGFVSDLEKGSLTVLGIVILVLVAIIGLILLIAELKPRTPRRVRMQKGTYITRSIVEGEVKEAAEGTPDILGSTTKVQAKRRPGAKINLNANVRRGENLSAIKSSLQESVQQRLARSGIPVGNLKIRLIESDPRETKTRVQ